MEYLEKGERGLNFKRYKNKNQTKVISHTVYFKKCIVTQEQKSLKHCVTVKKYVFAKNKIPQKLLLKVLIQSGLK